MGKKRKRVPNVLWSKFRDNAAPLSNTIISFIPKFCNCNAKGKCLRCVFGIGDDNNDDDEEEEAAMSYLVRPDDPPDYRNLMDSCFVVVPHDAPPLSPLISFTRHWSQLQIVERTIQALFSKEIMPLNVICHGYHKFKLHSTIVKVLTTWTWELVLKRVGDTIMIYLLTYTLIFMPIKCNAHQQVAGPLLNRLFARFPLHIPQDTFGSSMDARYHRKRRKGNGKISKSEEPASKVPCRVGQQITFGSKIDDYLGTHHPKESTLIAEDCSHGQHVPEEQHIEQLKAKPRKRLRLPSWQRRKRCKKLILQNCCSKEDDLNKTCQHGLVNNKGHSVVVPTSDKSIATQAGADLKPEQSMQLCPCCSVFQSLSRVPKNAEISRKFTFYNLKSSSSLFLEKHVLYSLKPGFAGVSDLFLHIFGLPNMGTRNLPALCFHKRGLCSHGSSCL